jgi:hypothetical protein
LNLYVSPVVNPVTGIPVADAAPVTVPMIPPASDVALYDVITEPLSAGASNQTVIVVGPVEVDLGFNGDEGTLADDIAASATAAVNVNVTAALVWVPWVAVTLHVTGAVAGAVGARDVSLTVHAALDANATMPVLDPPAYVRVMDLSTVPVVSEFDTVSAVSAAPDASPRMTGAPASAASEPPHPARSITAHAMTAPAAFPLPECEPNILN